MGECGNSIVWHLRLHALELFRIAKHNRIYEIRCWRVHRFLLNLAYFKVISRDLRTWVEVGTRPRLWSIWPCLVTTFCSQWAGLHQSIWPVLGLLEENFSVMMLAKCRRTLCCEYHSWNTFESQCDSLQYMWNKFPCRYNSKLASLSVYRLKMDLFEEAIDELW